MFAACSLVDDVDGANSAALLTARSSSSSSACLAARRVLESFPPTDRPALPDLQAKPRARLLPWLLLLLLALWPMSSSSAANSRLPLALRLAITLSREKKQVQDQKEQDKAQQELYVDWGWGVLGGRTPRSKIRGLWNFERANLNHQAYQQASIFVFSKMFNFTTSWSLLCPGGGESTSARDS